MGNPQQSRRSIILGWPVPALTVILIEKEGLSILKHREDVYPMDLNWELAPENRGAVS